MSGTKFITARQLAIIYGIDSVYETHKRPKPGTPMYPSPLISERNADFAVHIIGVITVLIAGTCLILTAMQRVDPPLIIAASVYAGFALASHFISAVYHLLPHHKIRAKLRKFDHSAILTLEAATFTPLLVMSGTSLSYAILTALWGLSILTIIFKFRGIFFDTRWALAPNFAIGFVALFAFIDFSNIMPMRVMVLILLGCLFYSVGTIFYKRKNQPYRYAIWHGFVLLGTVTFFIAIGMNLFQPA